MELGWWEELRLGAARITATPAKHWGARVIRDMHRGYGGYCLSGGGHSIYHSGDTAYFSGFKEIGQRLNPDVALLPIGAYCRTTSAPCTPARKTPCAASSI